MTQAGEAGRSQVLPTVLGSRAYFIDLGLRLFRETMEPGKYVDFDSVKGQEMCREAGVFTCMRCGTSVIVGAESLDEELRCVRCGFRK